MRIFDCRFGAMLLLAGALAAPLAARADGTVQGLRQPDTAPLPRLEAARTPAEHGEIAAWYERGADSAGREAAAHARMRDEDAAAAEHCRFLIQGRQLRAEGYLALARLHRLLSDGAHRP